SRSLAEGHAEPLYLGIAGAGLSLSAAVGSIAGGALAQRFNGAAIFVCGAIAIVLSIAACALVDNRSLGFLPCYWFVVIGLGCLYLALIGWLNQDEDAHTNGRGVSRRLIIFCIAWNLGMMCGQLAGGWLYSWGTVFAYGAAFCVALVNALLAITAIRYVAPR